MKKYNRWALFAVLFLTFVVVLVRVGDGGPEVSPVVTNKGPTGLSTFYALLGESGYRVKFEEDARGKLATDGLVIVPITMEDYFLLKSPNRPLPESPDSEELTSEDETQRARLASPFDKVPVLKGRIADYTKSGGNILFLFIDDSYEVLKRGASENELTSFTIAGVTPAKSYRLTKNGVIDDEIAIPIATSNDGSVMAEARKKDNRFDMSIFNGELALNANIAKGDNAQFLLDMVNLSAEGKNITIAEDLVGFVEPKGLFATIGPWAEAARVQVLVLLAVIAATFAVPFGRLKREVVSQRTTRDSIDAMASVFLRRKHPGLILQQELEASRRMVTKLLGVSNKLEWKDLWPHMPERLKHSVDQVYRVSQLNTLNWHQAKLEAQNLRTVTTHYISDPIMATLPEPEHVK